MEMASTFSQCKRVLDTFSPKDFRTVGVPGAFVSKLLAALNAEHATLPLNDGQAASPAAAVELVLPIARFVFEHAYDSYRGVLQLLPPTDVLNWVRGLAEDEGVSVSRLVEACDLACMRVPVGLVASQLVLAGRLDAEMYDHVITKRVDRMMPPDFMLVRGQCSNETHRFLAERLDTAVQGVYREKSARALGFLLATDGTAGLDKGNVRVSFHIEVGVYKVFVTIRDPSDHNDVHVFSLGSGCLLNWVCHTQRPNDNHEMTSFICCKNTSHVYVVILPHTYVASV